MNSTLDRFVRIAGGQILAAVMTAIVALITSGNLSDFVAPQYLLFVPVLGTLITTLDKSFRDAGFYGTSLDRTFKQEVAAKVDAGVQAGVAAGVQAGVTAGVDTGVTVGQSVGKDVASVDSPPKATD